MLTAVCCGTWRGGLWCRYFCWGVAARMGFGPIVSHFAVRGTFRGCCAMSVASDARAPLGIRPSILAVLAGRAGHAAAGGPVWRTRPRAVAWYA